MGLYLDSGYVNIDFIVNQHMPFNFLVGGRGTGKTYSSLDYVVKNKINFMFMRRTQSQLDLINKDEFSPFKPLNIDKGYRLLLKPLSKYNAGVYDAEVDIHAKWHAIGLPIGYTCALSTISNLRGFDASNVRMIIYDEFIKEPHEKPLREEGRAFLNAYETMNRNRELSGHEPIQVLCLANANDMGNPIFMELGLIDKAERMQRNGQTISIMKDRGIGIYLLSDSLISEKKKETALYKLVNDDVSTFSQMALANKFGEINDDAVGAKNLKEYRPLLTIGEVTIYKHKSDNTYYISTHASGDVPKYSVSEIDRERFRRKYGYLYDAYLNKRIIFETSTCEIMFNKYYE